MVEKLRYCPACPSYTLEENCSNCHAPTYFPKPPKFSLEDKYGVYRREVKKKKLIEKGLY